MSEEVRSFAESAWSVHPRLEMSALYPHSVQFALFERDPVPGFRERVASHPRSGEELRSADRSSGGSSEARELRLALLGAVWDAGFRDVTGDQVYLLTPDELESPEASDLRSGDQPVTFTRVYLTIGSNAPAGARWLVTRSLIHDDRALVWSLHVDTVVGRTKSLVLHAANVLDLEELAELRTS
jgi:hypothetical protein